MEIGDNLKKLLVGVDTSMSGLEKKIKEPVGAKLAQYSQDAATMYPEGSGWQDKQDAARHMLTLGDVARKTNPSFAKILGYLHEYVFDIGASSEDTAMDIHNNNLAALSLFNAKDYNEIKDRVKKLMENTQYQDTTDKTKPVINIINQ